MVGKAEGSRETTMQAVSKGKSLQEMLAAAANGQGVPKRKAKAKAKSSLDVGRTRAWNDMLDSQSSSPGKVVIPLKKKSKTGSAEPEGFLCEPTYMNSKLCDLMWSKSHVVVQPPHPQSGCEIELPPQVDVCCFRGEVFNLRMM
jgi:hypothetical protein